MRRLSLIIIAAAMLSCTNPKTGRQEGSGTAEAVEQGRDSINVAEPYYYKVCDQLPYFPGREQAFINYLNNHPLYVKNKKEVPQQVLVGFIVEVDGSITNIEVIKPDPRYALDPDDVREQTVPDADVVRIVEDMPKWIPGLANGRYVRVKYVLPIYF